MYLTSLYLALNLDTEVSQFDRDRVLRSLRDRVQKNFGARVTVRPSEDHALMIAFFEVKLEKIDSKVESILNIIDAAGEARIRNCIKQTFAWYENEFSELEHEREAHDLALAETAEVNSDRRGSKGGRSSEMRIYEHDDDEDAEFGLLRNMGRRNVRLPVRK